MEIGLAALRLYFDTGYWDRWAQYQAADAEYHNPLIPALSAFPSHHNSNIIPANSLYIKSASTPRNANNHRASTISTKATTSSSENDPAFFSTPVHPPVSTELIDQISEASIIPTKFPMIVNVRTLFRHTLHNVANSTDTQEYCYTENHEMDTISTFMPLNVSVLTNGTCDWEGENTNYYAIFAILLIIAGFVGNMLVCLAIWTERRLQTPTNYFLLSLAVADLLVSVLVMPLGIIVEIAGGNWLFNFPFCVLYIFSDMTGCTSSIMHMLVISIDRYLGIAKPLEQRNRSKSVVGLKIMGVWIISLAISSPVVFASLHDPINALPTPCLCEMGNEFIMVYGSIAAFFLPLAVMGVMMFLTARLLRKQAKWSQGKREGGGPRSRTVIKRHHPVTPPQVPQTRYFPVKSEPKKSNKSDGVVSNGNINTSDSTGRPQEASSASEVSQEEQPGSSSPVRTPNITGRIQVAVNLFNRRRQKPMSDQKVDSEKKATKVLGIVFGLFCVCWSPFFLTNLVVGVCIQGDFGCDMPPGLMFKFWLWLGWASSTVNPMVYTVVNPNFRQAFIRLLGWGHARERCRRSIQSTVQTCRDCSSSNATTKRGPKKSITKNRLSWSPTFLSALELSETPV